MDSFRAWPLLALLACSPSSPEPGGTRAPEDAPGRVERPEIVQPAEPVEASPATAPAPSVDPGEAPAKPDGECASWEDCTLVRDRCGRLHAVPVAQPDPPSVRGRCRRGRDRAMVPYCNSERRCEAQEAANADLRGCAADDECVVIEAPCDVWYALRRGHEEEALRRLRYEADEGGCPVGAWRRPPRPSVACLANVCVIRAAPGGG